MTDPLCRNSDGADWLRLAELDWVTSTADGEHLHAVGTLVNPGVADEDWYGEGVTACGLDGFMHIPGVISRMYETRCSACCKAVGMPDGIGSPKNTDACRSIAEARAAAAGREEANERRTT